jgi:DNA-directed RNA polymerase subunit RPC12/RpoP
MSRLWCAVWGHEVDNHRFARQGAGHRRCRCGVTYLDRDGAHTHVRHTLSCFLGHHTYRKLIDRDGHTEYVCVQCGHPLLFEAGRDRYRRSTVFTKKVRYLCGLFMPRFACHCGHTFLKPQRDTSHITHPLICVFSGHRVRYLTSRGGYAEYVCRNCGHPFCFA